MLRAADDYGRPFLDVADVSPENVVPGPWKDVLEVATDDAAVLHKVDVMNESVSREELRLHIDLLEQKAETRQVVIEGKIDRLVESISALSGSVGEVKKDNSFTRWSIAGIAVTTALAAVGIIVATQGTMTTANGNVLSAFQAGQAAAQSPEAPEKVTEKKAVGR